MRFKYIFLLSFLLTLFAGQLFGQTTNVRQLGDALSSGNVTLVSANGTGSILSATGRLRNNTTNVIQINVIIVNGIYLSNSGRGQNMIALGIYQEGFTYYSSGTTRYIRLPANTEISVDFDAYCADRERDAPQLNETFTRTNMPSGLQAIATRISNYYSANFDSDKDTIVQLLLWRLQGETLINIARTIDFTAEEWAASSDILGVRDMPPVPIVPGTYSYGSGYSVAITADGFTMNLGGRSYRGTYIVIENLLIMKTTTDDKLVFTIVNNGLQDNEGDLWRRR